MIEPRYTVMGFGQVKPRRTPVLAAGSAVNKVVGELYALPPHGDRVACMIEADSMAPAATDPTPPDITGLSWRALGSDDLATVVELAGACHAADDGLAFMIEPGSLKG